MEAPRFATTVVVAFAGALLIGVGGYGVAEWRSTRQPPCEEPKAEVVDAPIHVSEVADRLEINYYVEKGPQETQAEFELTREARQELEDEDVVRGRSRLLKVADDPSRILQSRFVTASGEVQGRMLTVTACVDPSERVALRGGVYTGAITVGGPTSPTIDVPIEVAYRSRLSLLVLASAPIIGGLVAWTVFEKERSSIFNNWWIIFVAGSSGAILGWWTYLDGEPAFSGTSLLALTIASWGGAAGAGAALLGLGKGKDLASGKAELTREQADVDTTQGP